MSEKATCHCGSVTLFVNHVPEELELCDCSLCSRRGMLWARYKHGDVEVDGYTEEYSWGDETVAFCHCPKCGCTTHWCSRRSSGSVGINARLFDRFEQRGTENVQYRIGGEPIRARLLENASG